MTTDTEQSPAIPSRPSSASRTHFDTLRYFETLRSGGFTEQQARAMTEALRAALAEYHKWFGDDHVYLVFACPWRDPAQPEFLGAYSSELAAQAFIDAQPGENIRAQLRIWAAPLNQPSGAVCPEYWIDPTGKAGPEWGLDPLGLRKTTRTSDPAQE